ncbi:iron-containing redox enzyme family protein [Actinocrispum sp. NPDC049592]|uniref:iron-containing redox enzyme family protein n=1 Tax=Actinocrispum sp. NPDC049592 TaxID=3154835 RepID=UPI003441DBDE
MSGDLRAVLDLVVPALRRSAAALWQPAGLRERYGRYLIQMHAVLRASVPLMQLAALRCDRPDPVCTRLGEYFPLHIKEEAGHDEWLLDDMATMGLNRAELPSVQVARLTGPQYYWINHVHPVALLGYIAVLEGNSPAPELPGLLAERTGLPDRAFHTLRHHATADPGHSEEVLALLAELDLSAEQRRAVRVSALHTAGALIDLFDALARPERTCCDDRG